MKNFKNATLTANADLASVIESLNKSSLKIVLIIDDNDKLLGLVTDSDIRREMLKKTPLESNVMNFIIDKPIVAYTWNSKNQIIKLLKNANIYQIPILDNDQRLTDLIFLHELIDEKKEISNKVILMAGGKGTRLYPLTKDIPKPLIPINGKPIISIILDNFQAKGFNDLCVSINHLGGMIKDELDQNQSYSEVNYIEESKRLGTAGALGLIKEGLRHPILVQNADTITTLDYEQMIEFHNSNSNSITVAVKREEYQIPYGVVNSENDQVYSIEEKPTLKYFSNTGIYVISPEVLKHIVKNEYLDMPTLIQMCLDLQLNVGSFLVHEYWTDIGQHEQLEKAQTEYQNHFKYA